MPHAESQESYVELSETELQETRRRLRTELATIAHWRRLIRARIDLTIAQATPPPQLGGYLQEFLSISPTMNSQLQDVSAQVLTAHTLYSVTDLPDLKRSELALTTYEKDVRTALMAVTDELVARQSA
ncbi:hypothetical protein [Jonesia quinghaiensis]|uniref:RsiG family protein n=1 Tax=Jonesia quinghaiensis TaxID=262806 RepID=UPI0003F8AF05|nr:hypothetical protein [Jonesia quinghaiensis]